MRSARGIALTAVASLALLPASASAASCLRVGVYQDDPARGLPALTKAAGPGVGVISTYLTAGKPLNPALVTFVNAKRVGLLVNWMPDGGRDGAQQPRFRVSASAAHATRGPGPGRCARPRCPAAVTGIGLVVRAHSQRSGRAVDPSADRWTPVSVRAAPAAGARRWSSSTAPPRPAAPRHGWPPDRAGRGRGDR